MAERTTPPDLFSAIPTPRNRPWGETWGIVISHTPGMYYGWLAEASQSNGIGYRDIARRFHTEAEARTWAANPTDM